MFKKIFIAGFILFLVLLGVMLYGQRNSTVVKVDETSYFITYKTGDNKVLDNYCIDKKPGTDLTEYKKWNQEEKDALIVDRQNMLKKTTGELLAYLGQANGDAERGDRLYLVGLKYANDGDLPTTFKYWTCGAQSYGDPKSMLKLAKLYFAGDQTVGVDKNFNKSYFWLLNAVYSDIMAGEKNNIFANSSDFLQELEGNNQYNVDYPVVVADSLEYMKQMYPDVEERIQKIKDDDLGK